MGTMEEEEKDKEQQRKREENPDILTHFSLSNVPVTQQRDAMLLPKLSRDVLLRGQIQL